MNVTLKPGDFVRSRYKGEWEYAMLREPHGSVVCRELVEEARIPKGAAIYTCVWKDQQLVPRSVTVTREGPATSVPPSTEWE